MISQGGSHCSRVPFNGAGTVVSFHFQLSVVSCQLPVVSPQSLACSLKSLSELSSLLVVLRLNSIFSLVYLTICGQKSQGCIKAETMVLQLSQNIWRMLKTFIFCACIRYEDFNCLNIWLRQLARYTKQDFLVKIKIPQISFCVSL